MIVGDIIGTDVTGTYVETTHVNNGDGIDIAQSATNNYVGNVSVADRNVIGGNPQHGIYITDEGTNDNYVYNNLDGLSPDGTRRVPNYSHGIHVGSYASFNTVGGLAAGQRNVFSGNGGEGIEITHGEFTYNNQVIGNYVGTDVTGNAIAAYTGNAFNGIHIEDGVRNNTVAYNVVGNNGVTCCNKGGITIEGIDHLEGNHVYNNWVGISPNGTAIPNDNWGVGVYGQQPEWGGGPEPHDLCECAEPDVDIQHMGQHDHPELDLQHHGTRRHLWGDRDRDGAGHPSVEQWSAGGARTQSRPGGAGAEQRDAAVCQWHDLRVVHRGGVHR
jgi:hypothetical protein